MHACSQFASTQVSNALLLMHALLFGSPNVAESNCFIVMQEVVVKPRLQWLGQQRGVRANTLGLPALDVAAAMAVGKSQVPSLNKMPFYDSVDPVQPVQQFGTSER